MLFHKHYSITLLRHFTYSTCKYALVLACEPAHLLGIYETSRLVGRKCNGIYKGRGGRTVNIAQFSEAWNRECKWSTAVKLTTPPHGEVMIIETNTPPHNLTLASAGWLKFKCDV